MPAAPTVTTSLIWGTQVSDPAISVYFAANGETFDGYTSEGSSAYEIGQFQALFDLIEGIANLTFTITADVNADFKIVMDDNEVMGAFDGAMGPPGESNEGIGVFDGQNIVRGPGGALEMGGYDFMVLAHETLHALGLAHPHDTGGTSTVMNGVVDSGDYGDFALNQGVYTVMTYNNGYFSGASGSEPDGSHLYGYESGPMALDISILQSLYGANMTTATGNNVYMLPDQNQAGTMWTSIWDAGGTDELQYQGTRDTVIDLRAATLLYEVGGGGRVSSAAGIAGGYTIANGVLIENATSGSGHDNLTGNSANNTLIANTGADTVDAGAGNDTVMGGNGSDVLNGESGSDVLDGGAGFDSILGGGGNDTINGGTGADTISGGAGNDLLNGGGANDRLSGNAGSDVINGDGGNDSIFGGAGFDTINGGTGSDTIDGGLGNDMLNGDGGNDHILGNTGSDVLNGDGGDDTLEGQGGNDLIIGGDGSDSLSGGTNNDTLVGGEGNDTMDGGTGADVFVFSNINGADVINDFLVNVDDLDFSGVSALNSFADFLTAASDVGADLLIALGVANQITLLGVQEAQFDAADFIF